MQSEWGISVESRALGSLRSDQSVSLIPHPKTQPCHGADVPALTYTHVVSSAAYNVKKKKEKMEMSVFKQNIAIHKRYHLIQH